MVDNIELSFKDLGEKVERVVCVWGRGGGGEGQERQFFLSLH